MSGDLLFAYYGDDLTGSTDALEGLARNGVETALFLDPPTPEDIERFDDLDAVGIAGRSRSMTPAEMDEALPPAFEALAELDVPLVHYKVCSTFDSSPDVGSIGRAIEIGQDVFDSSFVPLSQGTEVPHGRYVVFGNLFAVQEGETYRIDRHPTMSEHPVTPMTEADLTRHLGEQTDAAIGQVELPDLHSDAAAAAALEEAAADNDVVLFDAYDTDHLETIGRVVWERARNESGQLFAVGSSGFEHHALPPQWRAAGRLDSTESILTEQPAVDRIAVVSGSASPVTAAQIDWAAENGFETIRVETDRLVDPDEAADERAAATDAALEALDDGRSVVLYSARGPDDDAIERTKRRYDEVGPDESLDALLGRQLGEVFSDVVEAADLDRACISGGDTSGYVAPELDVYALEPVARTAPGAPLCRAASRDPAFDGLQITLKGGQTGGTDYFGVVRDGGTPE